MRALLPSKAQRHARRNVPALDSSHRLRRNERHPRVRVPARLPDRFDECRAGRASELRHLHRVLLRGRRDRAGTDVANPLAAAIHRHEHDTLLLSGGLECLVRAGRRGLVDGVDDVDVGVLLEAVLHARLAARLIAVAVGHAYDFGWTAERVDLGVRRGEAEALEETVVALCPHRMAREQVEGRYLRWPGTYRGASILANERSRSIVVGCKERVRRIDR